MIDRAWVDANAIIALLAGPSHVAHEESLEIFRRVADGELEVILTAPVLVELSWFLERRLGLSRRHCAERLRQVLDADGVLALDRVLPRALEIYAGDRRLDFVDAWLAASAIAIGPARVVSFDRDFDRIEGVTRVSA